MNKKRFYIMAVLTAVICFYLRAENGQKSSIPIQRVFAYVPVETSAPVGLEKYRIERESQRSAEMAALTALAQTDAAAQEQLLRLIHHAETELAIESALTGMGEEMAVCAVRDQGVTVCVNGKLDASRAQAIIEICAQFSGVQIENVFILDECGYL